MLAYLTRDQFVRFEFKQIQLKSNALRFFHEARILLFSQDINDH